MISGGSRKEESQLAKVFINTKTKSEWSTATKLHMALLTECGFELRRVL
jgi:hypothetical protein